MAENGEAPKRKQSLPKRFYQEVTIEPEPGGVAVLLDGKPMRTPAKAPLVLPNMPLAEALAGEWRAQGERIDPKTMPLTRLANSAIDGVKGAETAVADDIARYAGSDLVCYRADGPEGLVAMQAEHWDPMLAFARKDLSAPLLLAQGVLPIEQPPTSLANIRRQLDGLDAFSLAALHTMTGLTGSALLALSVARGRLSPEAAWKAAHVDEDWQISQWGEDAEAAAHRAARKRDFDAAARFLKLSRAR